MPIRIIESPTHCQVGKHISWYASKLINPDEKLFGGYTKGNSFTKNIMEKDIYNYIPYDNEFTINFKNNKINIIKNKLKYNPDKLTQPRAEFFFEIVLTAETDNIIDDFIKTSNIEYKENILDDYDEPNKINCWMFDDGYWESNYKSNKRDMSTIYLQKSVKNKIIEDIENFISKDMEILYNKLGIPYKRNYLFEGLPGTGKTSLIRGIATKYDMDIAFITLTNKTTDLVINKGLKRIPKKCLLILEDIDCLFVDRKQGDIDKNSITLSGILNILDGIHHTNGLITIMTTNFVDRLDKALIRPGRIDYRIKFNYAVKEQIEQMYNVFFPDRNDMEEFIKQTKNIKMTTSALQQFLFENLFSKNCNPLKNIRDLEKICQNNDVSEKLYI